MEAIKIACPAEMVKILKDNSERKMCVSVLSSIFVMGGEIEGNKNTSKIEIADKGKANKHKLMVGRNKLEKTVILAVSQPTKLQILTKPR